MAAPMTYDFILRDKEDPRHRCEFPLDGAESVCFYRLGQRMDDLEGICWDDYGIKVPVLDLLTYDFNTELLSLENVNKVMAMLFDNCKYSVLWEVKPLNGGWYRMTLTNLDDIPRGLFMHKMFVIRNLIRDDASYKAFVALLEGGVPFNIAAYFGAGLELVPRFGGKMAFVIKDYAGFISYKTKHFAHAIRSMAGNSYCEQKSLPWAEGWGYNYLVEEKDEDGRWLPLPQEITEALMFYKGGEHLPEGFTKDTLYDLDQEKINTLLRFICKDDNININISD